MLLYACETWPVTEEITGRIQGFINRKLRIICRIFWPQRISNEELWHKCHQVNPAIEVKKRKWGWIGHTLPKPQSEICRKVLERKRKPGRSKMTWRRTITKELEEKGNSWDKVETTATNRQRFKNWLTINDEGHPVVSNKRPLVDYNCNTETHDDFNFQKEFHFDLN